MFEQRQGLSLPTMLHAEFFPMGLMGLPFLTRIKGFSAKIYVTEASARLGQLMMEDLITMHVEFGHFYGPEEANFPSWLRQEELEILPSELREIILGKDGLELGGWMPLYRKLVAVPVSSSKSIIAIFFLQGTCALIYSDFFSLVDTQDSADGDNYSVSAADKLQPMRYSLCGSVLIPIDRLGTVLLLLEEMTTSLEASDLKVPVYIISSMAEELLALLNIIPEWLCKQRQEKVRTIRIINLLFAGEQLFAHVNLLKEKKIHVVPAIHSLELLNPALHFVLTGVCEWVLLFICFNNDVAIQILYLFLRLQTVQPLLKLLRPKTVLCPEELRLQINLSSEKSFSVMYYTEAETLKVPYRKHSSEIKIATDLASHFYWKTFKKEEINITKLKGELLMENGRHHLLLENDNKNSSINKSLEHLGLPDSEKLMAALSNMGISGNIQHGMSDDAKSQTAFTIHIYDPYKASIEIGTTGTIIITVADENVASSIYKIIDNILKAV
ncbi:hypothetical protein VNO80_15550 [Phaseolus coccineus]|uniref:Beta-Casp domain-containing protein n=1 Tax=Phaseolus coccineus TaxID=3886 RepID=A0AAN9R1X4_PHACN